MQILTILIINIFVGVAIYLLISLKLERSVSDFRQRRLRREMDEMLTEFNTAAERNISLLESKIQVMRRLLEQGGVMKGLDITVGMEDYPKPDAVSEKFESSSTKIEMPNKPIKSQHESAVGIKQNFINLADSLTSGLRNKKNEILASFVSKHNSDKTITEQSETGSEVVSIAKEFADIPFQASLSPEKTPSGVTEEKEPVFDDEQLSELFSTSGDKYALIQRLAGEGCPLESIARCSHMPLGEIKLVLNLQGQNYTL